MKGMAIDDPARMTDYERACADKVKVSKLKCGNIHGCFSLTIKRIKAVYFFRSREELEMKRFRYELYEGEGTVKRVK